MGICLLSIDLKFARKAMYDLVHNKMTMIYHLFLVVLAAAELLAEIKFSINDDSFNFKLPISFLFPSSDRVQSTVLFQSGIATQEDIRESILEFCSVHNVDDCSALQAHILSKYIAYLLNLQVDIPTHQSYSERLTLQSFDAGYSDYFGGKYDGIGASYLENNIDRDSNDSNLHCINHKDIQAGELLTVVTGFWQVRNKHDSHSATSENNSAEVAFKTSKYSEWFHNTLSINMPYIFFTTEALFPILSPYRSNINNNQQPSQQSHPQQQYPTLFVHRELSSFRTYHSYKPTWTNEIHVPTKDIATIWLEKIHLLYLASQIGSSEYYAWVDSGLSTYRYKKPPAKEWSADVIASLPKDRLCYCYIKDAYNYHAFSGGVMIAHKSIIPLIHHLFFEEYELVREEYADWRVGSDQIILTRVVGKYPHLFHKMSYDYGDIGFLWGKHNV